MYVCGLCWCVKRWGVMPPIDENVRLGDFVSPEQAFGLGEALHGLDPAEVRHGNIFHLLILLL